MKADFASLYDLFEAIPTEQAAIDYFRSIVWKNGERCPYCGHDKVYGFASGPMAGRQWKCAACREKFSIRVGTIFEDSKIPLRKWLAAIWFVTSHRKGIASTQLARDLKVSQKTAWFMLHRLRHAARTRSFARPLRGTVEVDESYFGGKDKNRHRADRGKGGKVVAIGLLERGGELRVRKAASVSEMRADIVQQVQSGARLMTDEAVVLSGIEALYERKAFNHTKGVYGDGGDGHTNSIEGAWALIKRQIYGIHHWVSAKHLEKYLGEAVWRYNRRMVPDANRIAEFLRRVDGPLPYKKLVHG